MGLGIILRFILYLLFLIPIQVFAEDSLSENLLGVGAWLRPTYDGIKSQKIEAVPLIDYQHNNLFISTSQDVLEGGLRTKQVLGLSIGLQLAYESGRDPNESPWLISHNIPSISPSLSWGGQFEFDNRIGIMPFSILARYRQNINSVYGAQEDLRISAGVYGSNRLKVGIIAQATWANRSSMQRYYGLTPQESATTGLATFTPTAGRLYNTGGVLWIYDLTRAWKLVSSVEAHYLQAPVLNSPLVSTNVNYYASLGLARQF